VRAFLQFAFMQPCILYDKVQCGYISLIVKHTLKRNSVKNPSDTAIGSRLT